MIKGADRRLVCSFSVIDWRWEMMYNMYGSKPQGKGGDMHSYVNLKSNSLVRTAVCLLLSFALTMTIISFSAPAMAAEEEQITGTETEAESGDVVVMPESKTLQLTQGEETTIDFGAKSPKESTYYFKVAPSKSGYITLSGEGVLGYVELCNKNKKTISKESKADGSFFSAASKYPYQRTVSFGVDKNVVYFIRIDVFSVKWDQEKESHIGALKWTNTAVANQKYGKSRSKAAALRKELTRIGVIKAGNTNAQWFRIRTAKKKISITFNAKINCGTLYMRVYYKSNGTWRSARKKAMRSTDSFKKTCTLKKRTKKTVTYYVKVYPKYKASGVYRLSWK